LSIVRLMRRLLSSFLTVFLVLVGVSAAVSASTVDGRFNATGPISSSSVLTLAVLGRGGVPESGVGSVALNVTVTSPTSAGFLTVWPSGTGKPEASNLNFAPGQTVPNMVIVPVGPDGNISIAASDGSTDLIVDVLGWFPVGPAFTGLNPARLMDTRPGSGTIDGRFAGRGKVSGGTTVTLRATDRGGVPPSGASSVALNVTVTGPTDAGFLTVWPAGTARPQASNLNFVPGQTVPNMVIVPVSADGQISVFVSDGAANILVDVLGWFPAGDAFVGLLPARLMDTRTGATTIDNRFSGTGKVAGGSVKDIQVVGRGGVPDSGVGSVALNVTVTGPTASGFVTVWPTGQAKPEASNLNYITNQTVPNMVIVPVSSDGQISVYVSDGKSDVIVDVLGWFPTGPAFSGLTPARLMDSRKPPTVLPSPPVTNPSPTTTPRPITADSGPCLDGQIKGNNKSKIYHVPGQQDYVKTRVDVTCFDTEAQAVAAGFRKALR
jgi:hypothetical protein